MNGIKAVSISLFLFALLFSGFQIGKYSRDEEILKDAKKIISVVGKNKLIKVEQDVYEDWNFQFYLLRLADISIEATNLDRDYLIRMKNSTSPIENNYLPINIKLNKYSLFILKK